MGIERLGKFERKREEGGKWRLNEQKILTESNLCDIFNSVN
jgi:hypothetical protein